MAEVKEPMPGMPPAQPEGAEAEWEPLAPDVLDYGVPDYGQLVEGHSGLSDVRAGEICRGRVLSVTDSGVIVDIGSKTEGVAPLDDFVDQAGDPRVNLGDEIDVLGNVRK